MRKYIYAIVSILIWGTTSIVAKLMTSELDAISLLCICSGVSTIYIFLQLAITKKIKVLQQYKRKAYGTMMCNGIIGMLGTNVFFFLGVDLLTAQETAVINNMWPIWIVIFASFILHEKIGLRHIVSICICILGMICVIFKGDVSQIGISNPMGVVYIMLGSICYGLYCVLNKKNTYDRNVCIMMSYAITFLVTLVICLIRFTAIVITGYQILGILWIGIAVYSVAYILWAKALDFGESADISRFAFISPFVSLLMSVVFLKETLELWSLIGLVIIMTGIFVQDMHIPWKKKG